MGIDLPNNLWKSPQIKARLTAEACFEGERGISPKSHYWVVVPQADTGRGVVELSNFKPTIQDIEPHEMQQQFAVELQKELQHHAHFDGLWIVGFTHPPGTYGVLTDTENCWGRLIMIWCDKDGDPQYTIENERPFIRQFEDGPNYWIEQAHIAHQAFLPVYGADAMKKDMGLKEGEHQRKASLESLNTGKLIDV